MLAAQADHGQKREPGERTKAKKGLTSKDPLQKGNFWVHRPPRSSIATDRARPGEAVRTLANAFPPMHCHRGRCAGQARKATCEGT